MTAHNVETDTSWALIDRPYGFAGRYSYWMRYSLVDSDDAVLAAEAG